MVREAFSVTHCTCDDYLVHGMDGDGQIVGQMNVTVSLLQALRKAQQTQPSHQLRN